MTSSSAPELTERPWRPVQGPADREAFFAAQARNRRTTWRLTALCLMGVALMGIPISALLTPLLLAALFLIGDLINLVLPLSDWLSRIPIPDGQPEVGGTSDAMAALAMTIVLVGPGGRPGVAGEPWSLQADRPGCSRARARRAPSTSR